MLFSGKRQPSLKTAKLIALALHMSLQTFVSQLEIHAGMEKTHLKNPRPYRRKVKIPLDTVPAT